MDQSNIRNFCIISHIDHGKSTLADRFLELTGAVGKEKMKPQYLDAMDLEREKGITIKMHPCRIVWRPKFENLKIENSLEIGNWKLEISNSEYILNLIDTPGHIDFTYEISRALACVEGAILLVDATKGIQAQTLFNLEQAQKQNLKIIGAVNKIDVASQEQIQETQKELASILNVPEEEILLISAKNGANTEQLLQKAIEKVPPPSVRHVSDTILALKALIFDSKYEAFLGVIAYIRVFQGEIKKGDKIYLMAQDVSAEAKEVGYFSPELRSTEVLKAGEIGYVKTGIKEPSKVKVGDTITKLKISKEGGVSDRQYGRFEEIKPLLGYKEPQPVLFLSLYPERAGDFESLKDGLSKLKLNDPALDFQPESKMALGRGFRCGFLGSLHAEITLRRLKNEFNLDLVATSPQVSFKILTKNDKAILVSSPNLWPEPSQIKEVQEPCAYLEIVAPNHYLTPILKLLQKFNAILGETRLITEKKSLLFAQAPLREIITGNFYDKLKSVTQGYGSFSFEQADFRTADLVKLDILIAGKPEDAFAKIALRNEAFDEGRKFLRKLKEVLPSQQFTVSLQAAVGGKIIARETIKAARKDVTAPLYGGDVTRKRKLLEIQKRGKKELKEKGRVRIPVESFLEILKS